MSTNPLEKTDAPEDEEEGEEGVETPRKAKIANG